MLEQLFEQQEVKPVAYAAFADNGNIRCWSTTNEAVGLKILAEEGSEIVPLYAHPPQPAVDAVEAMRKDADRLSWLTEREVDTIYFDDGRIIDIAGRVELRDAIDAAMSKADALPSD